jgi:flagellar FliL protein
LAKIFKKTAQEGEKKVERKIGPIMSLEPFLFNIAGNSSRFAKISLGIEMKDIKSMEEAKNMTLLIRDRILSVLGSKNIEVLMDVNSRDAIKQELLTSLKGIFKKPDEINAIYITDFIIQ